MQYTSIKIINKSIIIDIKEAQILNTFIKNKSLPQLHDIDETSIKKTVVYGAVLHNEACETIDHKQWLECAFAYPDEAGYNSLSILDIHLTPTLIGGGLRFTPFAALIESDKRFSIDETQGISAFLRYDDLDIITNMINRECIYAIRYIVEDSTTEKSNWRRSINEDKILEIAFSIK